MTVDYCWWLNLLLRLLFVLLAVLPWEGLSVSKTWELLTHMSVTERLIPSVIFSIKRVKCNIKIYLTLYMMSLKDLFLRFDSCISLFMYLSYFFNNIMSCQLKISFKHNIISKNDVRLITYLAIDLNTMTVDFTL